jgi:hypothetical protein
VEPPTLTFLRKLETVRTVRSADPTEGGLMLTATPKRLTILVAAALILALGAVLLSTRDSATAQEPVLFTYVGYDYVDPDARGFAYLPAADWGDELFGISCDGDSPQGGTSQVPSQVLTTYTGGAAARVRVLNPQGAPVSAPVWLVCTADAAFSTPAEAQQVKARHQGQAQAQRP